MKAKKLREKSNFAESWNTETREKRKLNESWNNEARKQVKSEIQTKIGTKTEFYILSSKKIILHLTTVCINGWALGLFAIAQLFNLKFCFIFVNVCVLGQPLMQAGETLNAIFFPNYRRTLRSYHSARFLLKIVTENCCPTSEICFLFLFWNLQRQFSDFSNLMTIFWTEQL